MYQQRAQVSGPGASSRASGPELAPGKRTLTEQLPAGDGAAGVQRAAAHGVSGPAQRLPYADKIQALFGRHDISGVQAHVGGAAAEGAAQIGAQAYATGNSIAFRQAPDLHTAAHEAAHVVQQRGGVQLKGGVGQVGDTYEQHADTVADLVVQGRSAESLLDRFSGGGAAAAATGAVQRTVTGYTDSKTLYADLKQDIGPPFDGNETLELGQVENKVDCMWGGTYSYDQVKQVLLEQRASRLYAVERDKRKTSKTELFAMYRNEIERTGTRTALSAVMDTQDSSCGVFLSTRLSECESQEQDILFDSSAHMIALPDLTRWEMFDKKFKNKLDAETNCRLIAEHELIHLLHTWNNGGPASTAVDEFHPSNLEDTVSQLQALIPQDAKTPKIGNHLYERLAYIKSSFKKSGYKKNNEAPAVMRELRRYLEALQPRGYRKLYEAIANYDVSCTNRIAPTWADEGQARPVLDWGHSSDEGSDDQATVKQPSVKQPSDKQPSDKQPLVKQNPANDDPNCCPLF